MKYIVISGPGGDVPVVFGRQFLHRYVAGLFAPMRVVSAGFVRREAGGVACYGRSAGLNIAARPALDTALVSRALEDGVTDQPGATGSH